uniref:Glutaminase A central domain-containing protein n=1 Tax=Lotharella oceanica TaxID=641309 RepID=A0A7S2TIW2_9EUKA
MTSLMAKSLRNGTIQSLCNEFDTKFYNHLEAKGGEKYALLGSLAYRQVTGALTVVWNDKLQTYWVFMKEISSDGDVSTVDVIYPAAPILMWLSPETLRRTMMPLLAYANNETDAYGSPVYYNLTWSPHHLGHWPICDLAPEKQEQMPVEETGNLFIMLAYVAKAQQDVTYLSPYWDVMDTWGDFLVSSLPDPGNQLCTDDFEGPSPHNVNLAAKGIVGMGAYAQLLEMNGTDAAKAKASFYRETARNYSEIWMERADAGDHYKLQYDLDNTTFSLKYNLIWDQILGLGVYPEEVFLMESKYYQTKMNEYGVPLDTRAKFTKTDWEMWVAAVGSDEQFQSITDAVFKFADETPTRVPFSDWYQTDTSEAVNGKDGFRARPVIGGIFAKMLTAEEA